jgi:hypothetical protein
MILTHDVGTSLAIHLPGQKHARLKYVYGGKPKPFFHPLCSPHGEVLSMFEPHDHVWHRGLWFTIKFVNGENFWEETTPDKTGTQRCVVSSVVVTTPTADSAAFDCKQEWVRPGGETIFDETRSWMYQPLRSDAYAIDFRTTLTPRREVLLDRTPFTTWGGYGGLTFRGSRTWQNTKLLFSDSTTSDRPTPQKNVTWCDLSGKVDGGKDLTAGVAIFDRPGNPRHPVPWYGSTGPGHYFNAAFLFEETMTLQAGQSLSFNYRVLVHDGVGTVETIGADYAKWTTATSS